MRGATGVTPQTIRDRIISTHTPHAGRDSGAYSYRMSQQISTHTPHAGRDPFSHNVSISGKFQLTRPMRGATRSR